MVQPVFFMRYEKKRFYFNKCAHIRGHQPKGPSPANKEYIMTIREIIQSQPLSEIISGIAMAIALPILFVALMVVLP
jgi:hypothetical protein